MKLYDEFLEFTIRDADISDLDSVYKLSNILNTVTLPANKTELEKIILSSMSSFSLSEKDPTKRTFLFLLESSNNQVIGVSQIFAKHGTLDSPHTFFSVTTQERYSASLNKYFKHKILRLGQSFDGPSEVGSLVLNPQYRSHPQKLGRILSFSRFLFIAMRPDLFSRRVIAELLPPINSHEEPSLWQAIGQKFTGLNYYEADQLSRENKEFILSLFPNGDIYSCLLSDFAQDVIGKVGEKSQGAAHLLSSIGFTYSDKIDPFDGGPHFEAETKDISIIKNSFKAYVQEATFHSEHGLYLIGIFDTTKNSSKRFKCFIANACIVENNIFINKKTIEHNKLYANSCVYVYRLN